MPLKDKPIERRAVGAVTQRLERWRDRRAFFELLSELDVDRAERVLDCAGTERLIACGCTPRWVPVRCKDRWFCTQCMRSYYSQVRERLQYGLRSASRAPGHLLMLSTSHVRPLEDRKTITRGWVRWRARAQKKYGRSWPYVGVWEMTPGRDGKGHVHMHLYYHCPGWQPWDEWREWWVRATDGKAEYIDFRRAYGSAERRAGYLAKYVTKGVGLGTRLEVEAYLGLKGFRAYSASQGYFKGYEPERRCPACDERYRLGRLSDQFKVREPENDHSLSIIRPTKPL